MNDTSPQKDEKLLPLGEPTLRFNPPTPPPPTMPAVPSQRAQSWGTVVSIVIIVLMIIIGAFYVWGKRIAENEVVFPTATGETAEQY